MERMSELETKDQSETKEAEDPRVYELGYLLLPIIAEENVPASYGNLKELILSFGAEVITDEMPKKINLAYSMYKIIANTRQKFDNAYFGWIKFYMSPEKILELKTKLSFHPELIRFLIVKTVKENTIAGRRFIGKELPHRRIPTLHKPPEVTEPSTPINKEEIDKEIDAMVAV